jgi:hypothetical protein
MPGAPFDRQAIYLIQVEETGFLPKFGKTPSGGGHDEG